MRPDRWPDGFHQSPTELLVALLGQPAVVGSASRGIGGRHDADVAEELLFAAKAAHVVDLVNEEKGKELPDARDGLQEFDSLIGPAQFLYPLIALPDALIQLVVEFSSWANSQRSSSWKGAVFSEDKPSRQKTSLQGWEAASSG